MLLQVLESLPTPIDCHRQSVLLLGRYNFNRPKVLKNLQARVPSLDLSFSTVHKSKGQEADRVVVLELGVGRYGFPSGVTDDPILSLVLADPEDFPNAEERRLLYVALTRARHSVHLLVPVTAPSAFARELATGDVLQLGNRNGNAPNCPECGGKLLRREGPRGSFLGCTNFPHCRHTRRMRPS
jgi:DNA helicase IV